jgi:hypothetical protein
VLYSGQLGMFNRACTTRVLECIHAYDRRKRKIFTRDVNNIGDIFLPFNRGKKCDSTPSDTMLVSCHSDDANIRGGGVVFYCALPINIGHVETDINVPVKDNPTAPQPVSPKLCSTLCLSADHICLPFISFAGRRLAESLSEQGMNSTRSQRF